MDIFAFLTDYTSYFIVAKEYNQNVGKKIRHPSNIKTIL